MTFPANEVEVALQSAYDDQSVLSTFLDKLVGGRVWVALPPAAERQSGVNLPAVTIDSRPYVPVFTSEEQMRGAVTDPEPRHMVAPTKDFLATLPAHVGLAINPGGEMGLPLAPETVQEMLSREVVLGPGASVRIGEPAEEPNSLLDALSTRFGSLSAVREARRCWAQVQQTPPGLVLVVDVDPDSPDSRRQVLDAVAEVGRAADPGFSVDVVFTNDRDTFTEWAYANVRPFYASDG